MDFTKFIIITLLLGGFLAMLNECFMLYKYKQHKKRLETKHKEGISLYGYKVNTYDFMSIINSMIAYIAIYDEMDVSKFFSDDFTRKGDRDKTNLLIERVINEYPIIGCKYVGDNKFVKDEGLIAKKCEQYQKETGRDDYIIPLFDTGVVKEYPELFNFGTKFQQAQSLENLLKGRLSVNFETANDILDDLENSVLLNISKIYG